MSPKFSRALHRPCPPSSATPHPLVELPPSSLHHPLPVSPISPSSCLPPLVPPLSSVRPCLALCTSLAPALGFVHNPPIESPLHHFLPFCSEEPRGCFPLAERPHRPRPGTSCGQSLGAALSGEPHGNHPIRSLWGSEGPAKSLWPAPPGEGEPLHSFRTARSGG